MRKLSLKEAKDFTGLSRGQENHELFDPIKHSVILSFVGVQGGSSFFPGA